MERATDGGTATAVERESSMKYGKGVGATGIYTYDGEDVILDDGSEGVVRYLNGPGIDNKLRMESGGAASYFLAEHLGSTNGLTDANGNLTSQAAYDSFGNQTGNIATRYGFTGRERDEFTGLMHYRARFYDPNLGRFISEDPIGFAGGDVNLYGYVLNRPTLLRDPFGKAVPIWDHYWYYYYNIRCGETGIESACEFNNRPPEQIAQDAFDRGVGSVSGLRFKAGFAQNEHCRLAEYYASSVYGDTFPTNVQRVHPHGELEDTLRNIAKTQKISKARRFFDWVTSWF